MRKFATVCLTGVICLSAGSIKVDAAGISGTLALKSGIASVMTEAYEADNEADSKVAEEISAAAETEENTSSSSVVLQAGIASVINEAYEADPEVDSKILEELTSEESSEVSDDAAAESETEVEADAAAESETEVEADAAAESETEVEAETAAESETEVEADAAAESETEVEAETAAEVETEVEAEAETEIEVEVETEVETDADTESETAVTLEVGIASVMSEAYEADHDADSKVLEEMTGSSEETADDEGVASEETAEDTVDDEADAESETEESEEEAEAAAEEDTESESSSEYDSLCIAQVTNYVNIRSEASEDSEILGKLYDESAGTIIEEVDGWYKITSGSVTGYVKADYVVTGEEAEELAEEVGETVATVTTETLRVREEASTDSSILGLIGEDEELTVTDEVDGWVQVSIEEGDGWVSTEYVELRTDFVEAESIEEEEARLAAEEEAKEEGAKLAEAAEETVAEVIEESSETTQTETTSSGSSTGSAVVAYACQFVGNPYVYGGSSLTNGTDCSGFVMSVYAHFGVSLPHSSTAMRSVGYEVSLSEIQPGDIICYSGHVAIYVGNNTVVHASTPATGITYTSPVNYKSIITIRRIF